MSPEEQIESIRCDLIKGGLYKEELRARCELLLAHIDAQAAQIDALKEKLVQERAYILSCNEIKSRGVDDTDMAVARQQLKADPDLQGVTWDE